MKKTIILAIAAAAFAAVATPSFAQNARAGLSATGTTVPAYVASTPEKCWVEDGYSRWSTCDGGQ
jgi:hypothetical protein